MHAKNEAACNSNNTFVLQGRQCFCFEVISYFLQCKVQKQLFVCPTQPASMQPVCSYSLVPCKHRPLCRSAHVTALLTGGCSWQHADRVVISRHVRLQSSRRGFLFLLLLFDRAGIPRLELEGAECSRRLQSLTRAGSDGVVSLKRGTFYFQPNLHSGKDTLDSQSIGQQTILTVRAVNIYLLNSSFGHFCLCLK